MRALLFSCSAHCNSHLYLAFSLLVQMPSPAELAFQKDHCTYLPCSFTFHLCSSETCLILGTLCISTPVCFCSCSFLTLARSPQTVISTLHLSKSHPFFRNSSDTTVPIAVIVIGMHSAANNRKLSSSYHKF